MSTEYQQELHKGFDPTRKCNDIRWNCIDYALSNPDAHCIFEKYLHNFKENTVIELFQKTCALLGIKTKQIQFSDISLHEGNNIIIFYWWEEDTYIDYHFIRRINGIWFEKIGQNSCPEAFPCGQLDFVIKQYDSDKKSCFIVE